MIIKQDKYRFYLPDIYGDVESPVSNSPTRNAFSLRQRLENGSWEKSELLILSKYLDPSDRVLELGACIGFLGVAANDILLNKEKHLLIEANPELMHIILKNKELNSSGYSAINCMIGDPDTDSGEFRVSDFILGSTVYSKTGKVVNVPIKRLSEFTNDYNFIIIDIEGGEYKIIDDYLEDLKKFDKILIEFHPFFGFNKSDIGAKIAILLSSGFKIITSHMNTYLFLKDK